MSLLTLNSMLLIVMLWSRVRFSAGEVVDMEKFRGMVEFLLFWITVRYS